MSHKIRPSGEEERLNHEGTEHPYTLYRCVNPKCRAEDMDRGNNGTAAPVLICWKCKGGAKMPPEKQMQMNVGMFQVKAEEAAPIIAKKLEERILHYLS